MKYNYLPPILICESVRIENGFAGSNVNGFSSNEDGLIFGDPDDPGYGYGDWDNGSY